MIYLLYCLYAHVHGQTNAFLYGRKGADSLPTNEHRELVIERCLAVAPSLAVALYSFIIDSAGGFLLVMIGEFIASALAFSFFHNRAYYLMRDRIDGTNYGSRHQSPSSTAKTDFSYSQRRNMLFASFGVLVVTLVLYIVLFI